MIHLPLDDQPGALVFGSARLHQIQRHEDGRQRIAQFVAEHGEKFVLAAPHLRELPRQRLGLLVRHHRLGDFDRVDHHAAHPRRRPRGLGDEVEDAPQLSEQLGELGAEEGLVAGQHLVEDAPGGFGRGVGQHLTRLAPDQLAAPHQLLEARVGQLEDVLRAADDGDGRGRLHEERMEVRALRLGAGAGDLFQPLHLVALAGPQRRFLEEALLARVLLEEDAHLGEQHLPVDGFDQVVDRAVGVALDDLALLAVDRRDEDDGRVAGALARADQRRGLEAVEVGHLYVEKDERALVLEEEFERLASGRSLDQPVAERLEESREREQVGIPIVDEEDRCVGSHADRVACRVRFRTSLSVACQAVGRPAAKASSSRRRREGRRSACRGRGAARPGTMAARHFRKPIDSANAPRFKCMTNAPCRAALKSAVTCPQPCRDRWAATIVITVFIGTSRKVRSRHSRASVSRSMTANRPHLTPHSTQKSAQPLGATRSQVARIASKKGASPRRCAAGPHRAKLRAAPRPAPAPPGWAPGETAPRAPAGSGGG